MWQVEVHRLVWEEDFPKLDPPARLRILKGIRNKLATHPSEFGEPLSGLLKGFWKLRIEEYRVVYAIQQSQLLVLVLKAGMRRDSEIYLAAIPRLRTLGLL